MSNSIRSMPRWLIVTVIAALLVTALALSGAGRVAAQDSADSTPTATATATATADATDTPTATADNTVTAAETTGDGVFAVGDSPVVADGPLNLRDSAGTDGDIVRKLPTGTLVTITDGPEQADGYTWYEVQTNADDTGWVAGEFLANGDTAIFAADDLVTVADGPLNVRDDSGPDGTVVRQLATGDTATILSGPIANGGYAWYKITLEGESTGWVAGEFLTVADDSTTTFAQGDLVEVVDGPLNVRDDASTDAKVVTQLATGDTAEIVSGPNAQDGHNWYEVSLAEESTGWVAGEFLQAVDSGSGDSTASAAFAVGDAVTVAVDGINFRAEAGTDADVLDTLDLNALFIVRDGPVSADGFTWYKVFNYYYGEGWVAGELLTASSTPFPAEEGS